MAKGNKLGISKDLQEFKQTLKWLPKDEKIMAIEQELTNRSLSRSTHTNLSKNRPAINTIPSEEE